MAIDRTVFIELMQEVSTRAHAGADLWIAHPRDQLPLAFQAIAGNATAEKVVYAIAEFLRILCARTHGNVKCGLCEAVLALDMGAIAVVLLVDQTAPALCIGVYKACARRDDVSPALIDELRRKLRPDLKTTTHNTPGHA
jgi:hypothetical protein